MKDWTRSSPSGLKRNFPNLLSQRHNLRPQRIAGRAWSAWWSAQQDRLPPNLANEIAREIARLILVKTQLNTIEAARRQQLAKDQHPLVAQLTRLRGIGLRGAWLLDKELFGWRGFKNRRQVAACLGLTPMPYHSGDSEVEQGISHAGNNRARALSIELAWRWLSLQPNSALTLWLNARFAGGAKRMRRVGIVALARRLIIALWRYVDCGEIPAGAELKPQLASNS
jgi:transposase